MKKNITVNLFGTLYAIDDDACKLLEQYLDNMRSYFSKREGGDEITDDIEHRVAELFSELKTNGVEAISMEHVRDIIQRIGNPEQMDESTATNESDAQQSTHATPPPAPDAATTSHKSSRKLYRDPQDQLLGGVMSGLCQYFGGTDPLPWRIIMVLLALFSFSTMGFIYLIAWAIIPAATTAEERLQMRGDPINPQTLNEELMRGVNRTNDYLRSPKVKNGARSFLRTLLNIIVFCLRLFVIFIVGAFIVATIVGIIAFIVASAEQPMNDNLASFIQFSPALFWYGLLALVSGLICLSILLYASLRMLLKSNNTKPLSSATAVTLIIIAVLSATSATVFGVLSGVNHKIAKTEWRLKNQTINGIFMENESRNKLAIDGWNITQAINCNDNGDFYSYNDDFEEDNDRIVYYFKKTDENRPMSLSMERTENLPAGKYRIEAVTSVEGPGLFIFYNDNHFMVRSRDTQYNGNFASMSYNDAMQTGMLPDTLSEPWWLYHQRSEVSQWSYQTAEFNHYGGHLKYGIRGTLKAGADKAEILRLRVVKVEDINKKSER